MRAEAADCETLGGDTRADLYDVVISGVYFRATGRAEEKLEDETTTTFTNEDLPGTLPMYDGAETETCHAAKLRQVPFNKKKI